VYKRYSHIRIRLSILIFENREITLEEFITLYNLYILQLLADVLYNDDVISATMFADPLKITCLSTAEILLLLLIALLISLNIAISLMAANSRSYFSKSIRVTTPFCDTDEDLKYETLMLFQVQSVFIAITTAHGGFLVRKRQFPDHLGALHYF